MMQPNTSCIGKCLLKNPGGAYPQAATAVFGTVVLQSAFVGVFNPMVVGYIPLALVEYGLPGQALLFCLALQCITANIQYWIL